MPLWFLPTMGAAQDQAFNKSQFIKIASLEGLRVKCLLQDQQGFQWIGTESGLYRYDGYQTQLINTNSIGIRLSADYVLCLFEDRLANLWIGTTNGLQRLSADRKSITYYLVDSSGVAASRKTIHAITQTHQGTIWCSANDGYLYRSVNKQPFARIAGSFRADSQNVPRIIEFMAEDEQGRLWIADKPHGFRKLNWEGQLLKDYFHASAERLMLACFAGSRGQIYAFQKQIFAYAADRDAFVALENRNGEQIIRHHLERVYQDRKGFLWLVTPHQLLRYDPQTKRTEDFTDSFMRSGAGHFQIECLYEDANDQLWVGSYFGVYKLNNKRSLFNTISLPQEQRTIPYFSTRGLLETADGHLLIGSYNGLFNYHRASRTFLEYKVQVNKNWENPLARAMVPNADGSVWIATENLGLLHYFPGKQRTTFYFDKPRDTTNTKHLPLSTHNYSLLKDNDGLVWLGGYHHLFTLNPRNGKTQLFDWGGGKEKQPLLQILALHQSRDHTIWVGTDYGLYRIEKGQGVVAHYTSVAGANQAGLTHHAINCFYEDKKGWLWLGTNGGGIRVFNPQNGRVEAHYTVQHGLADNRVCALLPGGSDQLWISTFNGLSRLDLPSQSFRNFYTSDGLPTNEFNQGSALAGNDGHLYFGSMDGIVSFDPDAFRHAAGNTPPPQTQVMLTKMIQHNGSSNQIEETTLAIQSLRQIRLHHRDKFFTMYFAPENLFESSGAHYQFAYRLRGLSDEWQNIGEVNYIQFAGLPAGEYTLGIKAMGSNGIWGREMTIPVQVDQAPYLTIGAFMLYALVAFLVMGVLFWFQLNRIRLKNELALELAQKEKMQELHLLKAQFFTNITHEFRTPLTLIIGPLEQLQSEPTLPPPAIIRQQHSLMYRNAQRLLGLISQLLDSAKLEAGSVQVVELPGEVVAFVGQLLETFRLPANNKGIGLLYHAQENPARHLFDPQHLEKILSNLLSNALKFTSEGGTVRVELGWSPGESAREVLCLRVTDTGIGIPSPQLAYVFDRFYQVNDVRMRALPGSGLGLYLVRELTKLAGGQVSVESEVEKGTTFTVTLPLQISDLSPQSRPLTSLPTLSAEDPVERLPLPVVHADAPLVLVVEDHEDLRAFITQGLAGTYRVINAADGAQGWQMAQAELPDLVIADVAMPAMDGFALSELIKSTPLTTHIAVILLTARTSTENRVQGLSSGANDYLTKPFNLRELQLRVANLFGYQQTLRQYWHHRFARPDGGEPRLDLPEKPAEDPFLREVYRVLDRELANVGFTVDQLADQMRVSTRTLHRKVTALTDRNASTLMRSYRLNQAAVLLREGRAVSEVAAAVGFDGLSYFAKCFKEQFSVTPSQYALDKDKQ